MHIKNVKDPYWFAEVVKKTIFDLHIKKTNPFGIHETCIKIAKNELIFEQYRMALDWDKYDTEVQNDDAIKCN